MSKIGWIALYRQIENHWLWDDKPFSKGQAWIDLLLLASHDESKYLLGNELISLKKGSFVTSELKLMERWGWGKGKTRAFLDLLQKDKMIIKQTDRRKTVINIVNYERFSNFKTNYIPQTDHERTTVGPRTDTFNNDNNYNNNIYIIKDPLLKETFEQFKDFRKSIKKPLTKNGVTLVLKKLFELSSDTTEQREIIQQSIRNGWRDIYPLKKEKVAGSHDYAGYDLEAFENMLNEKC